MKNFILLTILFSFVFSTQSFARKPAVEDFVGVESQDYQPTPKGTEFVFNFQKNLNSSVNETPRFAEVSNTFNVIAVFAFVALPFLMWFGITRNSTHDKTTHTLAEKTFTPVDATSTHENLAKLSDYRADEKSVEDKKKAS